MKAEKNSGYSLIELLVAVVILAIIVTPFLQSFLVSVETNQKAKKVEQATIAGQNIMEELKAAEVEELIESVKGKAGTSITETMGKEGKVITFLSDDIIVDNRVFQAKVTLSSQAVAPIKEGDPEEANEITDYNREKLVQLYSMDSSQDGFYVQPDSQDFQMAEKFGTAAEVMKDMYREITLNIDKAGNMTTAEVEAKYIYKGVEKNVAPKKQCIYVNEDPETQLRNIYIFFQPMYNSIGGTVKEKIKICNNNCIPVNVYLIKQTKNTENEANCKVDVQVLEKNRTEYTKDGELMHLTTIRTNLSDTEDLFSMPVVYKQLAHLTYSTDGINFDIDKNVINDGSINVYTAETLLDLKGLSAQAANDRVYKTKVDIYEKDDAGHEVLVSFTGTKEK